MHKSDNIIKPKGWLGSLNCAVEGLLYAFKTQKHIKVHYLLAVGVLVLSLVLRLPTVEFVIFTVAIVILLLAEMMNTAIEEVVNLIEDRHHIIAKNAKDVSAGAVLVSAIGVAIVAYMIFTRHLRDPMGAALREARGLAGHIAVISIILVLIAVVAVKAFTGKGKPLYGGMPSGHAAVAFSLCTSISLITLDPLVAILSFVMAVLLSISRLTGGIHTRFEVFMGSILGFGLTLLVFKIFFYKVQS
jgi:diacylglycerol kinase (ATP)